jgi:hypothetical protein
VRDSGRDFAAPWPGNGLGPAKLSGAGTTFLISTMGVKDFAELLRLILQAAMDDADRAPPSRPRSDIKSDESAMA